MQDVDVDVLVQLGVVARFRFERMQPRPRDLGRVDGVHAHVGADVHHHVARAEAFQPGDGGGFLGEQGLDALDGEPVGLDVANRRPADHRLRVGELQPGCVELPVGDAA